MHRFALVHEQYRPAGDGIDNGGIDVILGTALAAVDSSARFLPSFSLACLLASVS